MPGTLKMGNLSHYKGDKTRWSAFNTKQQPMCYGHY